MPYALCELKLRMEYCDSLKQKRSILSALLTRLKKYNLSVIESGYQDSHELIALTLVAVRQTGSLLNQDLVKVENIIETEFPNLDLIEFGKETYI